MKIKTLEIYGYGKWVDQTFEPDDNFQMFYGLNEAGKSTLQSFIKSMLFGFPRRGKTTQRFEPRETEAYGGRLLLTDTSKGDIWIERTSQGLNLTTTEGEELEESALDQILGGLDETLFDTFYSFSLENLQELTNVDAEQLSDYFLSIGTIGSDKFLKVAKALEKETDDMYRPQGSTRPINVSLIEYENQAKKVQKTQNEMKKYDGYILERQKVQEEIDELNTKRKTYEEKLRKQNLTMDRYDIYLKQRAVERKLEYMVKTPMKETAQEDYDNFKKQKEDALEKVQNAKNKINNLETELKGLTRLNWAKNREEERKQWLSQTNKAKETQGEIEQLEQRILDQEVQMKDLARRGQFYPERLPEVSSYKAYQEKLELGLPIQADIEKFEKEQLDLRAKRDNLLEQRTKKQKEYADVRQKIARLEAIRLNEEAEVERQTSLKSYIPGLLLLAAGIITIILRLTRAQMQSNTYLWAGIILLVIGLSSTYYVFYNHRKLYKAYRNSQIITDIKNYQADEKRFLRESEKYTQDLNDLEKSIYDLQANLENKRKEQRTWLIQLGYYEEADPVYILKYDPVKAYFEARERRDNLVRNKEQLEEEIVQWKNNLEVLLERFPTPDVDDTRRLIRHVEDVESTLTKEEIRGEALSSRIEENKELIKEQTQIAQDSTDKMLEILKATNSKDELAFRQKVQTNEEIAELEKRVELYKEQIKDGYEDVIKVESKQALDTKIGQTQAIINSIREEVEPLRHKLAKLNVDIEQFEEDGTYLEQKQTLANQEARLKEQIVDWGKKRIAMELIYRTLRQGMGNPLPEMNELADELFEKLSYGRYKQIRLNQSGIKVKHASDVLFEPHELSQGTLEQLYVALRLAFIETAKNMIKLPIIIDDAFVNFDDVRKTSVYQVLEDMSKSHQILYFTFDPQAKASFSPENIIDLDEIDQKTLDE